MLGKLSLFSGVAAVALLFATDTASGENSASPYALNLFGGGAGGAPAADRLIPLGGTVSPSFGSINPFYGNISPFYGNIQPFWGDLQPFWGEINPFYGNIQPFWGDLNPFYGNINPFWGTVQPFWGDIAPFWGSINPFWGSLQPFNGSNADQYTQLQGMLQDFYNRSETAWGERITQLTGKSFYDAFAKSILQKYGVDLNSAASLSGMSAENRARFFLDWYDGLMEFSGQDHVDHWMATVNWSPALTQDQGRGADAVIGLLDARITGDSDLINNIEYAGGYNTTGNDHGAAVASLIFAEHDGKGVMGIAPSAHVMAYNPFDSTNTASWQDVRNGVVALSQRGADVINVSLGVPGWTFHQGMADIISDPSLYNTIKNVVFVTAAGNDGVKQTADINWNSWLSDDSFIVVGSVGLDETISSFSNTPGEACIKVYGWCQDKDKLKYHFLVAPGEMILVSDNHGGVTRMSGTSFAAPLVSGALTLLYDRWPWLQEHPKDSVQMILQSAKDLGAPGVDSTYGWGLLDVEASQSPLSFDNLLIFQGYNQVLPRDLKTMALSSTKRGTWQATGASLYAFEYFGSTFRDFVIPLSSLLYGQTYSRNGRNERFQRYMYTRMIDWANGNAFGDIQTTSVDGGDIAGWSLGFTSTEQDPYSDAYDPDLPFQMGYNFHNDASGIGLHFGFGNGATTLFAKPGFGFNSDYDAAGGGVNPILGFASGDDYAGVSYDLFANTTLTFGYSRYKDNQNGTDPVTGSLTQYLPGLAPYEASAMVLDVTYAASDRLTLNANYTELNETTGLLGVQGMGALSLAGGAKTDALTVGAELKLDSDLSLAFSATAARTRPGAFDDSGLAVSSEGIQSTAFEVALYKHGIFDKTDAMRFALTQPLHIESGALEYTSWQVVNRDTGELGLVTDKWELTNGDRQLVAEILYSTPVLEGAGELSFTVKANLSGSSVDGEDEGVTVGSRFAVKW